MSKRGLLGLILLIFLAISFGYSEPTPIHLQFTIFSDGVASIEYILEVDPTEVREKISLFGNNYGEMIIVDQGGIPLDFIQMGDLMVVDTLGATDIEITYLTPDLTAKDGALWNFEANVSIPTQIILPMNSIITELSHIPLEIETIDERPFLTMPHGLIQIGYIIDITEKDRVQNIINDAEDYINQAESTGLILTEANDLLQQSKDAFQSGNYNQAEFLAEQAKEEAVDIVDLANQASENIQQAETSIEISRESGRTKGLQVVEDILQEARDAYSEGEYDIALSLAIEANQGALQTTRKTNLWLYGTMGIILIIMLIILGTILLRRSRPPEGKISYDLEVIFKENPDLRMDDREVIRYIAERGGELFANEIRERFDIPRTSTWRMIRRLVDSGILEERKVGGQSLVSINEAYKKEI
jgi:uncharacterized membrane protein